MLHKNKSGPDASQGLLLLTASASTLHSEADLHSEEGLEVLVSHMLLKDGQGLLPTILVVPQQSFCVIYPHTVRTAAQAAVCGRLELGWQRVRGSHEVLRGQGGLWLPVILCTCLETTFLPVVHPQRSAASSGLHRSMVSVKNTVSSSGKTLAAIPAGELLCPLRKWDTQCDSSGSW